MPQPSLAGVIGWPVAHSLSPRIHAHWLAAAGIDGAYVKLPVPPERLPAAIAGLRALGFRGANVTIPHKQAIIACCDALDASAHAAGAVNTLTMHADRIIGSNTDGAGFLRSLAAAGLDCRAGPVLLLGAGGAARAIAASLLGAGAHVTVTSRTPTAATALAATLPGLAVAPWSPTPALCGIALLINATAGGMHGKPPLAIDLRSASPALAVADIVYAPQQTPLLQAAQSMGLRPLGGIGMLLHQAALSFQQWFGLTPIIDAALERAVLAPRSPPS